MSYKIDMTSPDVDQQIALLKFYPEIMEKHFKPVVVKDVATLFSNIHGSIPKRTGTAISKFKKSVTGKGVNLTGRVGWWGANQPWYINPVEYGAKAHQEKRKKSGKTWNHPGFSARGFMAAGYSALKPMIDADMAAASDAVVKEMAVP